MDQLYKFLEHENIPITPDGTFLAYKRVDNNYYSFASGKLTLLQGKTNREDKTGNIFNAIGETIEAARNEISDDPNEDCSQGLHVGSIDYVIDFHNGDGHVIIVEVDPKDVVSVPHDTSHQKMRVSKYTVVSEYTQPLPSGYTSDGYEDEDSKSGDLDEDHYSEYTTRDDDTDDDTDDDDDDDDVYWDSYVDTAINYLVNAPLVDELLLNIDKYIIIYSAFDGSTKVELTPDGETYLETIYAVYNDLKNFPHGETVVPYKFEEDSTRFAIAEVAREFLKEYIGYLPVAKF